MFTVLHYPIERVFEAVAFPDQRSNDPKSLADLTRSEPRQVKRLARICSKA